MNYSVLADAYAGIEGTASRLEIGRLLTDLFHRTPKELIGKVVYLTQGKLYPDFEGIEVGIADKLAARAVAVAIGAEPKKVAEELATTGDLGVVVEALKAGAPQTPTLTVDEVYAGLDKAARASGEGSQSVRLEALIDLLKRATAKEAKYILRTATGHLRLGVGDMSVLDALSEAYAGGRSARVDVERAYNRASDLGFVAEKLAREGLPGVQHIRATLGKPIRPMLAERLGDPKDILEKLGGRCAAEYKYDGERLQIHRDGEEVQIFTRRLEKIASQFPEVADLIRRDLQARRAIVEGEVVAIDRNTGRLRPFQELMQRRRKHGIAEAMNQIPTALYLFDALLLDELELIDEPHESRRRALERVAAPAHLATCREVDSVGALEEFFGQAIRDGCEGLVCKAPHGRYQAGARGWLWIKWKRDYREGMGEPVDLLVVGAFHGRGRRGGGYGALLMAAYDPKADLFRTVCKLGTGFSDKDFAELSRRLDPLKRSTPHPRVDSRLKADLWFEPELVLEVLGAEITLSPNHTSGFAIRFPRFTGRYRDDKGPREVTSVEEIAEMYRRRQPPG